MTARISFALALTLLLAPHALPAQQKATFVNIGFQEHPPTEEEREHARQQIGISVSQQTQLEHLFGDSARKRKAVSQQLHDLFQQRNLLFEAYELDGARERDLSRKITDLQKKLLQSQVETEEKLRKILTHQQFDLLHTVLNSRRQEKRDGFRHRRPADGEHPPNEQP